MREWCISTDASFSNKSAGLGGVLVDSAGDCAAWFSIRLNEDQCNLLGADSKDTIIYELELLAACMAMEMWASLLASSYPVRHGDKNSIRFALIRGVAQGTIAESIMQMHSSMEVAFNSNVEFARVPTEANIADLPSRSLGHPYLVADKKVGKDAIISLEKFLQGVAGSRRSLEKVGEVFNCDDPRLKTDESALHFTFGMFFTASR